MAKKIEQKEDAYKTVVHNIVQPIELNNSAFSIVYNGNKKYSVVEIKFDVGSTNSVGPVKVIVGNLDIYEAQYEFKKATIDAGLFEIGLDK